VCEDIKRAFTYVSRVATAKEQVERNGDRWTGLASCLVSVAGDVLHSRLNDA